MSNFSSTVLLRDVTVTGNSAQTFDGADINNNASVLISNSTFSSNTATSNGGGLNVTGNTGALTLDDITISANRVTDGGNGGLTIGNNTSQVRDHQLSLVCWGKMMNRSRLRTLHCTILLPNR